MKHLYIIPIVIILSACKNSKEKGETEVKQGEAIKEFDLPESEYVITHFDTAWYWIFKEVEQTELAKSELSEIEKIIKLAVDGNVAFPFFGHFVVNLSN